MNANILFLEVRPDLHVFRKHGIVKLRRNGREVQVADSELQPTGLRRFDDVYDNDIKKWKAFAGILEEACFFIA